MEEISGFEFVKRNNIKKALAIIINDVPSDLSTIFTTDSKIEVITQDHPMAIEIMRHTTAHIMAQAVKELYPGAKIAIGPIIENGFYYDILCEHQFTPDDFEKIESKMKEIIKANYKITRQVLSRKDAIEFFKNLDEPFKVELIQDLKDVETVSLYSHADKFTDLCRGPHLPGTGSASTHFKLMKVAGAYWRGDSKRQMLQRIYATSWFTADDLKEYLHNLEEAEKRDHRKLGKSMDLFHMQEEAVGSVFWHPKGWTIYNVLKEFMRKCVKKDGYVEVNTPQMIDRTLWEKSGHWAKFRQNMFIAESEDRILAVKPMNCPGGIQIFNQGTKSYKDLPIRMAEFGSCCRNEPSGSLYGIMRVRAFTQDDAHIFCTPDQINSETKRFCELLSRVYKALGFETFSVKFSDRPELRAGTDEIWDNAETLLQKATTEAGLTYTLNKGEGAFYGPKLEFVLKDKLGRDWQCGTLQVDFVLPERLGAWYIGEDGEKHHPIMLHRAVLGSLERFIGILLENYAGKLPYWLAPVQMVVATITNDHDGYAKEFCQDLVNNEIRAELDLRAEKISYKLRNHIMSKVPMVAVIGANEEKDRMITIRYLDASQEVLPYADAIEKLKKICAVPEV